MNIVFKLFLMILILCVLFIVIYQITKDTGTEEIEQYEMMPDIENKIYKEKENQKKNVHFNEQVSVYQIPVMKREEYPEYFGGV